MSPSLGGRLRGVFIADDGTAAAVDHAPPLAVRTSAELGIPVTSREAVAFAILGAYRMHGKPNILPGATGASRAVSGGAIHQP